MFNINILNLSYMDYLLVSVSCIFHPFYAQFYVALLLSLFYMNRLLNNILIYLWLLLSKILEDLQNHVLLFLPLHTVAEAEEVFSNFNCNSF